MPREIRTASWTRWGYGRSRLGATWVPEWRSRLEDTTGVSLVLAEWVWVWVAACPGIHMVRCRVGPTRQDVEMVQSCLYLRRGGSLGPVGGELEIGAERNY